MKLRIIAHLAIILAAGTILCPPATLQAKRWLLEPQGEQEIILKKLSPDRQELDKARELLVRGKASKASKMLEKWLKKFPESSLRAEATYYTAQCLEQRGKLYKAFGKYETIAKDFADSEYFHKTLEAQFEIAQKYLNGRKRRVLGIFKVSADDVGVKILEDIPARWPSSLLAQRSLIRLGDYYLLKRKYDDAVYTYEQLIVSYPASRFLRQARLQAAKAYLAKFNGAPFDPAPLVEAKERLLEYQRLYGTNPTESEVPDMLAKIDEMLARRQYEIGRFYERTGKKDSAKLSYQHLLKTWPGSKWAADARERLKEFGK